MRDVDVARLREPLGIILGWSELLRTGQVQAADMARALDAIARNARLQAEVIHELTTRSVRPRRTS